MTRQQKDHARDVYATLAYFDFRAMGWSPARFITAANMLLNCDYLDREGFSKRPFKVLSITSPKSLDEPNSI